MSKIINYYNNNLDKCWYNSSNVLYSECDDNENELKTLRVVFKNGKTYEYKNVNVNDYLLFREDISQGKALNRIIKKYDCNLISPLNIDEINNELKKHLENE